MLVVILVVALFLSGLAIALTTTVRSTAMSSASSLASAQALYLAEMGINEGIYRKNMPSAGEWPTEGVSGIDGAGTGEWVVSYDKDALTFESTGTVKLVDIHGEDSYVTRTVYQSIQLLGTPSEPGLWVAKPFTWREGY